ncbi:MAG: hypothetical protein FJX55_19585 [Alphaproteobacteria bacterium]|nr:hypothetical protein [Alphaproteobacteria bacterium]
MSDIISFAAARSPAESAAWAALLNARLAYLEHQSQVTRVAVQSAFQAFALSMGLSLSEARQASARLDAINGWEQSPNILIGAVH